MANDQNKCFFTGRLGKDPELIKTQAGLSILKSSIAVGGRKKQGDDWVDSVEWVPFVAFGRTAEIIEKYCNKGSHIRIEGRFQTQKWQDKDGNDRYTTDIAVDEMQLIGGKPDSNNAAAPTQSRAAPANSGPAAVDDDIPF